MRYTPVFAGIVPSALIRLLLSRVTAIGVDAVEVIWLRVSTGAPQFKSEEKP